MTNQLTTLGFDPGFSNGALVETTIELNSLGPVLTDWKLLANLADNPLDFKSPLRDVMSWTIDLNNSISDRAYAIGIEWAPHAVYWQSKGKARTNKLQNVIEGFYLGYFTFHCQSQGLPVIYLTPAQLKKHWNLGNDAGKKYLDQRPFGCAMGILQECEFSDEIRQSPDVLDATLLSLMIGISCLSQG